MRFLAGRLEAGLIGLFLLIGMQVFWTPDAYFGTPSDLMGGPSSPYQLAANSLLLAFLVTGCLLRRRAVLHLLRASWPALLLVAVALLSVFWSDAPALSLRRAAVAGGATLLGVYVLARYDMAQLAAILVRLFLIAALASLLMILFEPQIAISTNPPGPNLWRGAFVQKNDLGMVSALGIIVATYALICGLGSRSLSALTIALGALLLYLSDSVTALVGLMAAGGAALLIGALRRRDGIGLAAGYLMLLAGLAAAAWVAFDLTAALGILNRNPTLTSRTDIWRLAVVYAARRPWLGYGFDAFWRVGGLEAHQVQSILQWPVPSAHSAWMEVRLGMGWLGFAALAAVWLIAAGRVLRLLLRPRAPHVVLCGALLAALFTHTLTESTLLDWTNVYLLFVISLTHLGRIGSAEPAFPRTAPVRAGPAPGAAARPLGARSAAP